jgi:hypothetical protein
MTLCIAAITDTDEGEHIVGCCDWRVETSVYSAETLLKFRLLPNEWCAMFAGSDVSHASELCDAYKVFLAEESHNFTDSNLLEMLRIPPRQMRWSLADAYTHSLLAVPYEEFLKRDHLAISDEYRRQIEAGVAQQQIKADLILMGLVNGHLVIARYADGAVTLQEDFAAIGSGSFLAESFLYLRSQGRAASLAETIYCIYEAKRVGELAPGVGHSTHMFVMSLNEVKKTAIFTYIREKEDIQFMDKQLRKFAPRPLNKIALPPCAETIQIRIKSAPK